MTTLLSKQAILSAPDIKIKDVQVPEWEGTVRVSTLSGAARDKFTKSMILDDGKPDTSDYRQRMVAACIVGEDGLRLFSDDEVAALGGKSAAAIDRVFAAAESLNKIGPDAVAEAEGN